MTAKRRPLMNASSNRSIRQSTPWKNATSLKKWNSLLVASLIAFAHFASSTSTTLFAQESATLDSEVKPAVALEAKTGKRVIAASSEVKAEKVVSPTRGITLVPYEKGLERIIKGREPQNLDELLALEKQQAKVASKIKLVTVNVQQGSSQGSGVIITGDGYVYTAAHVAGKPNMDAYVIFADGKRVKAKTLGMNRNVDAGLIKITEDRTEPWPHASIGSSRDLKEGDWCIASGHPGGWQSQRGSVIRVGRILANLNETLVTDCSLIGGDSGGPLFDLSGRLIGIHSRIGTEVTDNMHVPVDEYNKGWERLIKGEKWGMLPGFEPIIGVQGDEVDSRAIIKSVTPEGPGALAGIEPGDVILRFDGQEINSFDDLKAAVKDALPGDQVRVELKRGEKILTRMLIVGLKDQ